MPGCSNLTLGVGDAGETYHIPEGMGQNPFKTALARLLANNGFYTHEPNRKLRIFTKAETSKESLSITRTVWPKPRKAMPPGTHSMPLSAQVIRSVQEQQGRIAEGSMVRSERDRCRCFRKHYTTLSECNHSCPFHTLNTISPWYLIQYETGLEVQDPHRPNQVQMKPSQQVLVYSFFLPYISEPAGTII